MKGLQRTLCAFEHANSRFSLARPGPFPSRPPAGSSNVILWSEQKAESRLRIANRWAIIAEQHES